MGKQASYTGNVTQAFCAVFLSYLLIQWFGGFKLHWIMIVPVFLLIMWSYSRIYPDRPRRRR